jgi:hypothetical protein
MIIGINGPLGSGKNEVAKILEKNYGFKAIGFADKLKESFAALFDVTLEDIELIKNDPSARVSIKWTKKNDDHEWNYERSFTGRASLQRFGTESHRDIFGYDFWVDALIGSLTPQDNVAIYDARFNNELAKIKQYRGITVQVRRPGHEFDPTHPSEAAPNPDLIDHIIYNNSTLDWLEIAVKDLVRQEKLASPGQSDDLNNLYRLPSQLLEPSSLPLNVS